MLSSAATRMMALISCCIWPIAAMATADGPDYYAIKAQQQAPMHQQGNLTSPVLMMVTASHGGLKNLGCHGQLSFSEWQKLDKTARAAAKQKVWCNVALQQQTGWVQQHYLREYSPPSLPTFDCEKTSHSIEKLICDDPALIQLDHQLSVVYQQSLHVAQALDSGHDQAVNTLKATQRGWIKGRNECWKATSDQRQCAKTEYQQRISQLQIQWMLVTGSNPDYFSCANHAEIVITYYSTPINGIALEYGDNREILLQTPSASGSKYTGQFGHSLWLKGDSAMFSREQDQPAWQCNISEK